MKLRDLTEQRFGYLTVLSQHSSTRKGNHTVIRWLCRCDCGTEKPVTSTDLIQGRSKTCNGRTCLFALEVRQRNRGPRCSSLEQVFRSYRLRAKHKGNAFEITSEEFDEIAQQNCYYCCVPPSNTSRRGPQSKRYVYNGIDRIDSSKGYVRGNMRPCCWICNRMKNTLSAVEFLAHIKQIAACHG